MHDLATDAKFGEGIWSSNRKYPGGADCIRGGTSAKPIQWTRVLGRVTAFTLQPMTGKTK